MGQHRVFLGWDDWGGEYDHVVPPTLDSIGLGLRVPEIIISPYAKKGYIDHQLLSVDAINKFIEDNFVGSQRLDPATDGRPDSRPVVRESSPQLGDVSKDFDFGRSPAPPILLPLITMTKKEGPGHQAVVNGTHFKPGDTIKLVLNCGAPDCPNGQSLGTATADASGSFNKSVTVPSGEAAGNYFFAAEGTDPLTYFAVTSTRVTTAKGKLVPMPEYTSDD